MTTTISHEEVRNDLNKSHACAYLKGYVVGHAVKMGMKWDGDHERTQAFKEGWDDGHNSCQVCVTYAHILYNRLRHNRPHRNSGKLDFHYLAESEDPQRFDDSHIGHMLWEYTGWTSQFNNRLANTGIDVKPLLSAVEAENHG